jgi:hypothetical protein
MRREMGVRRRRLRWVRREGREGMRMEVERRVVRGWARMSTVVDMMEDV